MRARSLWLLLALLLAASTARGQVDPPRVTLREGATLPEAVSALARAVDGVVVADVAAKERRLEAPLTNATLDEALAAISVSFDQYWVRRGRMIGLQLRRSDPEEPAPLEVEEAQLVAKDIARLLPFVPAMPFPERDQLTYRFVASITAEQEQRMQTREGVPYADLTQEQQMMLRTMCLANAYGPASFMMPRAAYGLQNLGQTQVTGLYSPPPKNALPGMGWSRSIQVRFDDPSARSGETRLFFTVREPDPQVAPGTATRLSADGRALPTDIRTDGPAWRHAASVMTLREFAEAWEQAIGTPLRTPAYAAERRFWVCSVGATRTEAVQALADLWGWESHSAPRERRLGRPAPRQVDSLADLHSEVQRIVPPGAWHAIRHGQPRRRADYPRVYAAIERLVGVNVEASAERLDPDAKRRLVNAFLEEQVNGWLSTGAGEPQIREDITHPETITLRLGGPLDGARPPMLHVSALRRGIRMPFWGTTARRMPKPRPQ